MTDQNTSMNRLLPMTSVRNARDIGGYPTGSGATVRWRTLLRTAKLATLTVPDRDYLADLGLRTVIDLRTASEITRAPDALSGLPATELHFTPLFDLTDEIPGTTEDLYRYTVEVRGAQYAGAARALAQPGALPALVHCSAGKDRTGVLIALLLDLLGVDDQTIVEDYLESNVHIERGVEGSGTTVQHPVRPEWIIETLAFVHERFGSAAGFFRAHGLSDEELDGLRGALLEGLPSQGPIR